jgi:hypothetical protein
MKPKQILKGRAAMSLDVDTGELDTCAIYCARLVSFEEKTEPQPSLDTTTIMDNAPLT